ncbi:MAG: DUF4160 domain-containing protein [Campylobacterota bacterium]|nr:DUF4160 domain-containing protein [Campylobacterota bacterium]
MPTVLKVDGWRFFFFSDEHNPTHIHIEKADAYARIELESLEVTDSYNLKSKELKKLVALVRVYNKELIKAWNEYFKK